MKRPSLDPRRPECLALTAAAILVGLTTNTWAQVTPITSAEDPSADAIPTEPAENPSIPLQDTQPEPTANEADMDPVDEVPVTSEVALDPSDEEMPAVEFEDLDAPAVRTTYVPSRLPWESSEVPDMPEWRASGSRFQNPAFGTSALGDGFLPSGGSGLSRRSASNPIRLGLFDIYPSIGYQASFNTGVPVGSSQPTADTWVHSISPSIRIRAGSHWQLVYNPRYRFFSDDEFNSALNHNVTLGGWATYEEWTFRLDHRTAINNDPLIETGRQTKQSTHSTSLGASFDRGSRGAFDFSITQNLRLTEDENNTFSWDAQTAYTVPLNNRIRVGGIVSAGYDMSETGTDMVNQRINGFISGPLGRKITYNLTGGAEFRQFVDSEAATAVNPLVSLNLTYRVLSRTTLSLALSHSTSTSYFSNQFTENTTAQAILSQTLTDRWSAVLDGGWRLRSYRSTDLGNTIEREDTTMFAGVGINGRLTQRITTTARYEFRQNDTDNEDLAFDSHQITLGLNWSL
jgi:hypothetical protein